MASTEIKKHLSFGSLIRFFSSVYLKVPDWRQAAKTDHSIRDTSVSGVAMMHFQAGSLLQFQRQLELKHRRSNLSTMFGVDKVPSDTQMREILDEVPSDVARLVFRKYCSRLQRGKYSDELR